MQMLLLSFLLYFLEVSPSIFIDRYEPSFTSENLFLFPATNYHYALFKKQAIFHELAEPTSVFASGVVSSKPAVGRRVFPTTYPDPYNQELYRSAPIEWFRFVKNLFSFSLANAQSWEDVKTIWARYFPDCKLKVDYVRIKNTEGSREALIRRLFPPLFTHLPPSKALFDGALEYDSAYACLDINFEEVIIDESDSELSDAASNDDNATEAQPSPTKSQTSLVDNDKEDLVLLRIISVLFDDKKQGVSNDVYYETLARMAGQTRRVWLGPMIEAHFETMIKFIPSELDKLPDFTAPTDPALLAKHHESLAKEAALASNFFKSTLVKLASIPKLNQETFARLLTSFELFVWGRMTMADLVLLKSLISRHHLGPKSSENSNDPVVENSTIDELLDFMERSLRLTITTDLKQPRGIVLDDLTNIDCFPGLLYEFSRQIQLSHRTRNEDLFDPTDVLETFIDATHIPQGAVRNAFKVTKLNVNTWPWILPGHSLAQVQWPAKPQNVDKNTDTSKTGATTQPQAPLPPPNTTTLVYPSSLGLVLDVAVQSACFNPVLDALASVSIYSPITTNVRRILELPPKNANDNDKDRKGKSKNHNSKIKEKSQDSDQSKNTSTDSKNKEVVVNQEKKYESKKEFKAFTTKPLHDKESHVPPSMKLLFYGQRNAVIKEILAALLDNHNPKNTNVDQK